MDIIINGMKHYKHRLYTESEQLCEFKAPVPLGITETKRK
jgi:hypothetical protein